MELRVLTTSFVEPVSLADMKHYLAIPKEDTTQDQKLGRLITIARSWLEGRTALSLTEKSYKVQFIPADSVGGWFELPVSPVSKIDEVKVRGTVVEYEQKGLNVLWIKPDLVWSTGSDPWSCDVTFTAGADNETANMIIQAVVTDMYNNINTESKEGASIGRLSYEVIRMIETISEVRI